jgi:hypothetical protein
MFPLYHALRGEYSNNIFVDLAHFLHNTGNIIYFDDKISGLNDLVILDPQLLV